MLKIFYPFYKFSKKGFSLIEFLIVMAIMVLLASILSPSLQKTLNAAKELTCKNNLKSQGIALAYTIETGPPGRPNASHRRDFSSYTINMEGYLPYVRSISPDGALHFWYSVLGKEMGYFKDSGWRNRRQNPEPMATAKAPEFRCPSADEQINWNLGKFSYGYNMYLGRDDGPHRDIQQPARLFSEISFPHKLIAIADMEEYKPQKDPSNVIGSYFIWPGGRHKNGTEAKWHTTTRIGIRHNYGSNNLFLDGHVEHLPYETINYNIPKYLSDNDASYSWH